VRFNEGQTFSDLLNARKQQLETSLASASIISWALACANTSQLDPQDSNRVYLEGFVHASTHIQLGSLKRVLPKELIPEAGEIMEIHFEAVKPGPGNNYMHHPNIKKFLEETSLDPLASDKRKRVDYRGSSASNSEIIHAKTWFGRGAMRCSDSSQVEAIFRSEAVANSQMSTLGSAELITFACCGACPQGQPSAASTTVQVEVLVHSSKPIRRGTLEAWLDPAQHHQIVKVEWDAVETGKGSPYSRDPTVQKFLAESALDPPMAGKRPRVDLAGPSGLSPKKCGRKVGYRKPPRPGDADGRDDAARCAAAGAGPAAAADAPPRAAPRRSLSSAGASQAPGPGSSGGGVGRGSAGASQAPGLGS
jgi:hypothetical protein